MSSEEWSRTNAAIVAAEAEIEKASEEVAAQVSNVQHELAQVFEWRRWVRRFPKGFLLTALALGYAIGVTTMSEHSRTGHTHT